jgi:hypothetical protein
MGSGDEPQRSFFMHVRFKIAGTEPLTLRACAAAPGERLFC